MGAWIMRRCPGSREPRVGRGAVGGITALGAADLTEQKHQVCAVSTKRRWNPRCPSQGIDMYGGQLSEEQATPGMPHTI